MEEDNIIVKWAQEDVETSCNLLNNNNNNNNNNIHTHTYIHTYINRSWLITLFADIHDPQDDGTRVKITAFTRVLYSEIKVY